MHSRDRPSHLTPAIRAAQDTARVLTGCFAGLVAARALTAVGYYGAIPFLVVLFTRDYGHTEATAGVVVGAMVVTGRLAALPLGQLADRMDPYRLLTGTNVLSMAALMMFAFAPAGGPLWLLFAAAVLQGLGAAGQYIGFNTLVPRLVRGDDTPTGYGLMGMAFNLGAIVGPAITGGLIAAGETRAGIAGAAILYLAGAVAAAILLQDDRARPRSIARAAADGQPVAAPLAFFVSLAILYFVTWALIEQLSIGFAVYALDHFGVVALVPAFFSIQAVLAILGLPLAGSVMHGWDLRRLWTAYAVGTLLIPLGYIAFGMAGPSATVAATVTLVVLITLSEVAAVPAFGSLVALASPVGQRGRAFGALGIAQAAGLGIGAVAGGYTLTAAREAGWLPGYWLSLSAIFGSVGLVACAVGWWGLRRTST